MTVGYEVPKPALTAAHPAGTDFRDAPLLLESRGWSSSETDCAPKVFALASLVNLAAPDPVARITYNSRGNLLIIAGDSPERARRCAQDLAGDLHVTLLTRSAPVPASYIAWSGEIVSLTGFLGEFDATIAGLNGARADAAATPARFDLVLDFSAHPLMGMRQPPQGYFHAPSDEEALDAMLEEVREYVGEFEKPKYFAYRESICAHSRSQVTGCNKCIEICSTQAIVPDGDKVKVDPHLCMGCGACATVCPSGAMSYQYPRAADRGAQMKQLINAYRHAGGADPCIVFHNGGDGRALLAAAAAAGRGLPARALPLETWHVAAVGLDLLLPAVAFGANQVAVIAAGSEDSEYLAALREQMAIGETILSALGYAGTHFALIEARDGQALQHAFAHLAPEAVPGQAGIVLERFADRGPQLLVRAPGKPGVHLEPDRPHSPNLLRPRLRQPSRLVMAERRASSSCRWASSAVADES